MKKYIAATPARDCQQGALLCRGWPMASRSHEKVVRSLSSRPGLTIRARRRSMRCTGAASPVPSSNAPISRRPSSRQFVRKGVSVMPFFRKTEISDTELDALAAFLSKQK